MKLNATYSKKAGLPCYSSHSFCLTIEKELPTQRGLRKEAARLYKALQRSVDELLQQTGFVPSVDYGMQGNGGWKCSKKQRQLIEAIAQERQLDAASLNALSVRVLGAKTRELNRVQASRLIGELQKPPDRAFLRPSFSTNGTSPANGGMS